MSAISLARGALEHLESRRPSFRSTFIPWHLSCSSVSKRSYSQYHVI